MGHQGGIMLILRKKATGRLAPSLLRGYDRSWAMAEAWDCRGSTRSRVILEVLVIKASLRRGIRILQGGPIFIIIDIRS